LHVLALGESGLIAEPLDLLSMGAVYPLIGLFPLIQGSSADIYWSGVTRSELDISNDLRQHTG